MSILVNNTFKDFIHNICKNYNSVEEFNYTLSQTFKPLAKEFSIGRFVLEFNAPVSIYSKHGVDASVELYSEDNYSEKNVFKKTFQTAENGSATFVFYPDSCTVWGDSDKEQLSFLAEELFIHCGRARLMGLIRIATTHDSLTGALITKEMFRRGGIMIARGTITKYCAIFMNIKNFKLINQIVGSAYGDDLMSDFCNNIFDFLDEEEMLTRLGGDNFVVFVQKVRIQDFISLFDNMNITVDTGERKETFKIEARMGIYMISSNDNMATIMNNITSAYQVARMGIYGDHVYFQPVMIENEIEAKKTVLKFSKALKNEKFVVYYQPKVSTDNMTLCGAEALSRWKEGDTIIPPYKFIPILERDENICKLDFYVLNKVCIDIKEWIKKGIEPVRISVNFSKNHLVTPDFAKTILEIINKNAVDPKYIEVELTESSGFDNLERMINFIRTMERAGVAVSIDDFGTGYSSLSAIKKLDAEIIKIDKSFIDGIGEKTDQIILKNIIIMLKELHKTVLAEGVESYNQALYLKNIGCDIIQGYLYDKPLPKTDYEMRLKNGEWYKNVN